MNNGLWEKHFYNVKYPFYYNRSTKERVWALPENCSVIPAKTGRRKATLNNKILQHDHIVDDGQVSLKNFKRLKPSGNTFGGEKVETNPKYVSQKSIDIFKCLLDELFSACDIHLTELKPDDILNFKYHIIGRRLAYCKSFYDVDCESERKSAFQAALNIFVMEAKEQIAKLQHFDKGPNNHITKPNIHSQKRNRNNNEMHFSVFQNIMNEIVDTNELNIFRCIEFTPSNECWNHIYQQSRANPVLSDCSEYMLMSLTKKYIKKRYDEIIEDICKQLITKFVTPFLNFILECRLYDAKDASEEFRPVLNSENKYNLKKTIHISGKEFLNLLKSEDFILGSPMIFDCLDYFAPIDKTLEIVCYRALETLCDKELNHIPGIMQKVNIKNCSTEDDIIRTLKHEKNKKLDILLKLRRKDVITVARTYSQEKEKKNRRAELNKLEDDVFTNSRNLKNYQGAKALATGNKKKLHLSDCNKGNDDSEEHN